MEMRNGPLAELFLFYLLIFVSSFYIVLLILYFPFIVPIVIGLCVLVYMKATKSQRDAIQARSPKDSETELRGAGVPGLVVREAARSGEPAIQGSGAETENQENSGSKSKSSGLPLANIQRAPTVSGNIGTATVITLEAVD